MTSQPEAWLRGPVAGIAPSLQPVAHSFIGAREDVAAPLEGLTEYQLWLEPGGAASIGFHMRHLAGATDRLLTYARGEALTASQKEALAAERAAPNPRPTAVELLREWDTAVESALRQLAATSQTDLGAARLIGRAQLPSTVLGLMVHAGEHATRHAGQIITTAKIVRGLAL